MRFLAIEVETAGADLAGICRIGALSFEDEGVAQAWQRLVAPEDSLLAAPAFREIADELRGLLSGQVVVCHGSFDRVALSCALERHGLAEFDCSWLDTAKVARRAWPQFARKGYSLANVAAALGIELAPQDPHANARAAGEILRRAVKESGLSIEDWMARVKRPIDLSSGRIAREGNPEGPLAGEVVVFTGSLAMSRRQAAEAAARAGCAVGASVGQRTTLLVVGSQDARRLAGRQMSSKQRRAEELIAGGRRIRIVGESDFLRLIGGRPEGGSGRGRLASLFSWLVEAGRSLFFAASGKD